uniref:CND06240-like protein n=1 Tax=Kwoniella heveanensis TaxID=89924 RepID=D1MBM8_9TREE|nr:CND06240-like protein [Kwoniella heveanensis]
MSHAPAPVKEKAQSLVAANAAPGVPAEVPVPLVLDTYVPPQKTWKSYIWSTLDVPKDEARFLTKLDLTLISSAALGVMIRYLDQVNITNAFNSGMKEDLELYGNELNFANALWSAAYVFGQIPSNLLLTRVNAPRYIAFLEFAWTAFTFGTAGRRSLRSWSFPRGHVCLLELLQASRAGEAKLLDPDLRIGRSLVLWFLDEEIDLAKRRMPTEAKFFTGLFKWKDIKRWHTTWHVYLLIFWVKSYNVKGQPPVFSVAEINIIPLGINVITIVGALTSSWISDSLPGSARWPSMVFAALVGVIIPAALGSTPVHPEPRATRWVLFCRSPYMCSNRHHHRWMSR